MEIRDLVRIERELQRQVLAASGAGIRASLFNLVVFERREESGLGDKALAALFGLRPARVLRVEAGHPGRTEAEVSARCSAGGADRAVCFEEIRIRGGEDGLGRDPGCWTPLLIPGVPVHLWWLEPVEQIAPLLGQVEECADRLIVHTSLREEAGDDPLQALRFLAGELESIEALSDLAWRRILPLRRWAARLFDPPENREGLEQIERVRLEGGPRGEGWLLFLWLAARLGWEAERLEGPEVLFRDRAGRPVRLEHRPSASLAGGFLLGFGLRGRPGLSVHCGADGCRLLEEPAAGGFPVRLKVPTLSA